ncbi:helix-turn-helix domain-containing protein [Candidatus Pyrohabitans sp.]
MPVTLVELEEVFERRVEEIGGKIIASPEPGRYLKELREGAGVTQEELGTLMDLRRESISRIENGGITPSLSYVRRFSRVIAALKIVRELIAREEVSLLAGRSDTNFSPRLLRLCLGFSAQELKLISELGVKSYQRTKKKALRRIRK